MANGGENDLNYAVLQKLPGGNLLKTEEAGDIFAKNGINIPGMTGTFTLEAGKGVDDGSAWKRGIYLGCGKSAFIEFGSYDLVKILDHEGKPVQPYYDEFIQYIGDVPLMVWSGWEDGASKESAAQSMMTVGRTLETQVLQ